MLCTRLIQMKCKVIVNMTGGMIIAKILLFVFEENEEEVLNEVLSVMDNFGIQLQ